MRLAPILDQLEQHYGKQKRPGPADAYEMILYANCGYPANDISCPKGFDALRRLVGVRPDEILAAPEEQLAKIMRLGGIVPELRARRLKEIAGRVRDKFAGDLATALAVPLPAAKKILKQFPTIGDPGAEKILLFTNCAPVPAIPSGHVHVLHRLGFGQEKKNYAAGYRSAQEAVQAEIPPTIPALQRAYLLLQRHGRELCKRTKPVCARCPLSGDCKYAISQRRS
jgi:endonuclease III